MHPIPYWFLAPTLRSINTATYSNHSISSILSLALLLWADWRNYLYEKAFLIFVFHIYIITENHLTEMLVCSIDVKQWRTNHILICRCLMLSYQPLCRSNSVLVSKLQLLCHSQVPFHSASWLWLLHPTFCWVGLLANEIFISRLPSLTIPTRQFWRSVLLQVLTWVLWFNVWVLFSRVFWSFQLHSLSNAQKQIHHKSTLWHIYILCSSSFQRKTILKEICESQ